MKKVQQTSVKQSGGNDADDGAVASDMDRVKIALSTRARPSGREPGGRSLRIRTRPGESSGPNRVTARPLSSTALTWAWISALRLNSEGDSANMTWISGPPWVMRPSTPDGPPIGYGFMGP